ncbi:MAG: hypothetical protein PSV24_16310 [Rhodoferax sp.]|nr:hypothetical protein [Rhodoferax sp.]
MPGAKEQKQKSRHEDGFFAFADSAPVTNGELAFPDGLASSCDLPKI